MTEQQTQGQDDAATGSPEQQEAPKQPKPTETVEFWKQKAREQESRAKANAEAANKLKEYEDRDKTEAQRLAERAEAAERRAADLEVSSLRLEVAAEKGLTPAQAKRLVGTTRDEIVADADDLLSTFAPKSDTTEEQQRVVDSLDLGSRGSATSAKGDPAADFAKFLKRELA